MTGWGLAGACWPREAVSHRGHTSERSRFRCEGPNARDHAFQAAFLRNRQSVHTLPGTGFVSLPGELDWAGAEGSHRGTPGLAPLRCQLQRLPATVPHLPKTLGAG